VITIGDVTPHLEWIGNPLYVEYYRPNGMEHMLSVELEHPVGQTHVIHFQRSPGRDYDHRDHLVMALLRPHVAAAIRRITPQPHLTPREREILEYVRDGYSNAQIAQALTLSPATVRTHLEHAFSKLGVHSRTEAVNQVPHARPSLADPEPPA
jgi:DNA-binding CsgD family transcriptional regulator